MMKIVKEGLWVLIPSTLLPIFLIWWTRQPWYAFAFIFSAIMIFFFRDPSRKPPTNPNLVLAPADGTINGIDHTYDDLTLFIELHVVNCHLQRTPMAGKVTKITRTAGKHRRIHLFSPRLAYERKKVRCATENAKNEIEIELENSKKMWLTQIVGFFARRLKSYVNVGEIISAGQKVGLIYFGSMVKLQVQGEFELKVQKGSKVKAGETVIAIQKNA